MGYPMTFERVCNRNQVNGDYRPAKEGQPDTLGLIAGDLRRLEKDTLDDAHLRAYARLSGATEAEVKEIFEAFFFKPPFPLMNTATPLR